jgi:hypothetical protein
MDYQRKLIVVHSTEHPKTVNSLYSQGFQLLPNEQFFWLNIGYALPPKYLLIVPTMDVEDWGRHEHELHSRVAPVRAAEYGIPIFRLASSGISQAVSGDGKVIAQTSFPGSLDILSAKLRLPTRGSLPLDRYLAPFCVGATGIIMAGLLVLAWKDRRRQPKG